MKRYIFIASAILLSASAQAVERKFSEGYAIAQSRINTNKTESGLSLLDGKLAFSRNDTVYLAELDDSLDIKKITPMPDLSSLGIEGQFAQYGKTIVFSKGGELYQAEQNNRQWGNPQKLKIDGLGGGRTKVEGTSFAARRWTYRVPSIKGMYNPAISKNGKRLYFIADFEGGAGGKDIWYSDRKPDGKTWTKPTNLGSINTPADEDYPFLAGDTAFYYTSAVKDTLRGRNIFKTRLKGGKNAQGGLLPSNFNSNSDDENFVVAKGCPFLISNRNGNQDIYRPEVIPVIVETPAPDTTVVDSTPKVVMKDYKTCVFYFDYDKTTLIDSYEKEFNYIYEFVNSDPNSKFTINGHTDTRGGKNYNQNLSTNRAKIVYDRLIEMGVDKSRLVYKGFGKSQPDIKNATTEEEHQKNRRVEIIKLD